MQWSEIWTQALVWKTEKIRPPLKCSDFTVCVFLKSSFCSNFLIFMLFYFVHNRPETSGSYGWNRGCSAVLSSCIVCVCHLHVRLLTLSCYHLFVKENFLKLTSELLKWHLGNEMDLTWLLIIFFFCQLYRIAYAYGE